MYSLQKFLLCMAQDFRLERAYAADPEKVMQAWRLPEADKQALRSGSDKVVHNAAGLDAGVVAKFIFVDEPRNRAAAGARKAA